MNFVIRLLVTAVALWAAVALVPGIENHSGWFHLVLVALIFGAVNAVIRPILLALTCPLVLLTLGLFIFVLNALMLWLTGYLSDMIGLGFHVDGFIPALIGGLVVGLVSTVLNIFVGREKRGKS